MRSEKALTLFNQTVGIKVLGNLDQFIRDNMLESQNVEAEFFDLKKNYDKLLGIYRSIEKARLQIKLLEPIVNEAETFGKVAEKITGLETVQSLLPPFFAEKKLALLDRSITEKNNALTLTRDKSGEVKQVLEALGEEKTNLQIAISQDATGAQIKNLEAEIRRLEHTKIEKQQKSNQYNDYAQKLDFPQNPGEKIFLSARQNAADEKAAIAEQSATLNEKMVEEKIALQSLEKTYDDVFREINSLKDRKNQIPAKNISLRAGILQAVNAQETDIPFIGELIRVKESEKDWENAIERVLHNFALCLLVPEHFYGEVNRYVHRTNLGGRVVYHKVKAGQSFRLNYQPDRKKLISKVEINPKSNYREWIESRLLHNFDYTCENNLTEFQRHKKAITKSGLIKSESRHEKDDRPHKIGRERYVLGWDNREKIKLLLEQLRHLKKEIDGKTTEVQRIEKQQREKEKRRELLGQLLHFDKFAEIDWQKDVKAIQELSRQRDVLLKTSNRLASLKAQLEQVKQKIEKNDTRREKLREKEINLERDLREQAEAQLECRNILQLYVHVDLEAEWPRLQPYFPDDTGNFTLKNIETRRKKVGKTLKEALAESEGLRKKLADSLQRKMDRYKNPAEKTVQKHPEWRAETMNLLPTVDYIGEFTKIYDKVLAEDLPGHEAEFKKYLNESVVNDIASFRATLDKHESSIADNIDELNAALKAINFSTSPSTFIQLKYDKTRDTDIRNFRQMLRSWEPPDAGKYALYEDPGLLKKSFLKIQEIIKALDTEENWRKKVTDVRNWLTFSATEFYREDGKNFKHYESSGSLSGGEAAQLTYTILGAAIAYQFGIERNNASGKSFRFFVVDEAFSKLDPEKSHFLMALCKQLELQLLVVTPLDKINVVEKYISACHYVENKEKRNSEVYDLTIEQYDEKKHELAVRETEAL